MYEVIITPAAQRQIDKIERAMSVRILARARRLAEDPRPVGAIKLAGSDAYRLRVGDYRIVYTIESDVRVVWVIRVAHRRDVYR